MKYILDRKIAIAIMFSIAFQTMVMYFFSNNTKGPNFIILVGLTTVYSTVIPAIFGWIVYTATPLAAGLIVYMILGQPVSISNLIMTLVFGASIGFFAPNFKIRDEKFEMKNIIGLNVIVMMLSAILYIMIRPLVRFFIYNSNVYEYILSGAQTLLFQVLLTIFISSPILVFTNRLCIKNNRDEK